jgi:hypothetical protein
MTGRMALSFIFYSVGASLPRDLLKDPKIARQARSYSCE